MRRHLLRFIALAVPALTLLPQALAQTAPSRPQPVPAVTRADVAAAYVRFERAYLAATLDETETIRVNRAFDALTLAFFGRNYAEVARQLDALTASIDRTSPLAATPWLGAYCPRLEPAVSVAGAGPPALRIDRLYDPAARPVTFPGTLRVAPSGPAGDRKPIDLSIQVTVDTDGTATPARPDLERLASAKPGRYDVGFVAGGQFLPASTWSVVSVAPRVRASSNTARLARLPANPRLAQAVAAVTARNALLVDTPDPASTVQVLQDPEALAQQIEKEIAALERGVDPFVGRAGDYWRIVRTETGDVPLRVYCPASRPGDQPRPLLIVFHGAGGDENMFLDAYGNGLIKRIADARGILVASPLTTPFAGAAGPAALGRLIETMQATYPIETTRIYALGHSMGGMTVAGLARAPDSPLAAAVCLNGFSWPAQSSTPAGTPPLLVVSGELDPLSSPARMEAGVRTATEAGARVEYRTVRHHGHMLSVVAALPDAVAWLLEKRR